MKLVLPAKRARTHRGSPELETRSYDLVTTTRMFGGSADNAARSDTLVIRPTAVRTELKRWWRALRRDPSPEALWKEESLLWGTASATGSRRSRVEVRVRVDRANLTSRRAIDVQGRDSSDSPYGYAMWPGDMGQGTTVHTRMPGVSFELRLTAPSASFDSLEPAVLAMVAFGGIGGRTRRGCGSLGFSGGEPLRARLPHTANDVRAFLAPMLEESAVGIDHGRLSGSRAVWAQTPRPGAESAWKEALDWLKVFRQGDADGRPARAGKYGRSKWPEADSLRNATGKWSNGHAPRHPSSSSWPRAEFGLPIPIKFAPKDSHHEPGASELVWSDAAGKEHPRLASPLVLKPLQLAGGGFVALGLWLNRRTPPGGSVHPKGGHGARAASPFGAALPSEAAALYRPLQGRDSVAEAFIHWVRSRGGQVYP